VYYYAKLHTFAVQATTITGLVSNI